jgi:VanZ family protein
MKLIRLWGPVVVWMTIIFLLSNRQSVQVSDQTVPNFIFFKTLHVIEYAILFTLNVRAFKHTYTKATGKLWFYSALAITILYAMSDEIHQTFIPTREGRLRDVIIDASGAIIAWILLVQLLPKVPKKLRLLADRFLLL